MIWKVLVVLVIVSLLAILYALMRVSKDDREV